MSEKAQPEAVTPTQQQVSLQDAPIEALLAEFARCQMLIVEIQAEIIRRTKGK